MTAMASFHPSGIVTLLTDFGLADPFVGVMKGRILSRFAGAHVVDLSHEVPVHEPEVAGFWLARCFEEFPAGTVHVAVVDPGVGTPRAILCMMAEGHALLAPDNGLLAGLAARYPRAEVVALAQGPLAGLGIGAVSATFHGRDIFAPVAAELAAGRCAPQALGAPASVTLSLKDRLEVLDGTVVGHVVTVDHFGNLITNIGARSLESMGCPEAHVAGQVLRVGRTYADVEPGRLLALVNSFDVLEIALRQGSAAAALAIGRGARVRVRQAPSEHLLGGPNRL
jgi:S-adenosyl-L-methionine hydrolase (adenosine-forming)